MAGFTFNRKGAKVLRKGTQRFLLQVKIAFVYFVMFFFLCFAVILLQRVTKPMV